MLEKAFLHLQRAGGSPWPRASLALALALAAWMGGSTGQVRPEIWAANALLVLPAWLGGPRGCAWSRQAFPFWGAGALYANFHLFGDWRLGPVHVDDLYLAEKAWFGLGEGSQRLIASEWFAIHNHPAVDFLAGAAYILYLYQPLAAFTLFFFWGKGKPRRLALAFLLANLLGMAVYLAYPAAPPWYVAEYGLGPARPDAPPSAAGAARFDALVGVDYFAGFYRRNTNVFGAVPSLHAAYPLIVFLCSAGMGRAWRLGALGFALWVGFSALYLQHHYLIDVLAGYSCAAAAVLCILGAERLLRPPP